MDEKNDKNTTRVANVTAAGNAWIICKSKSHPGINYYFNTLTGEAVWNLSNAEIEKARTKTKLLESQPGNNLHKCPEPKEPPIAPPLHNSNYACQNTNFSLQSGVMLLDPQCSSQSENASHFYNSLGMLNGVPINIAVPSFNSNVWSLPPQTQFIVSPLVNPMQTTFTNVQLPISKVKQDMPAYNTACSNNVQSLINNKQQNLNYKNRSQYNIYPGGRAFGSVDSNFESDLRQKLEKLESTRNDYHRFNYIADRQLAYNERDSKKDGKFVTQISKDYTNIPENITKFDLRPLKNLAPADTLGNSWYIVVDTNTILRNFGFLTNLTDSDKTCHLMVPTFVMEQLQTAAKKDLNARRILRFLTQEIATGLVKAEEKHDCVSSSNTFDLCLNLSLKKHHVILLTEDKSFLKYKGSNKIIVMTVFELKNLLNNSSNNAPTQQNVPLEKLIKIIVPNDVKNAPHQKATLTDCQTNNELEDVQKSLRSDIMLGNKTATDHIKDDDITEPNINIKSNQSSYEIPTDDNNAIRGKTPSSKTPVNRIIVNSISTVSGKSNESTIMNNEDKDLSIEGGTSRKRIINLRHNLNQCEQTNKKKRWTIRKKCNENVVTAEKPASQFLSVNATENSMIHEKFKLSANEEILEKEMKCRKDNIEFNNDCSSTNSVIITKNISENIIIDESSMSGVISNTESNVDVESLINYKTKFVNEVKKPIQRNVMVNIPSAVVEEHLLMRCEEWMFRFIQIMEEVLSQILQQDPPFLNSDFPPPWTLHEATQCIIKKFSHCCYVVDAANKLSIVLYELSDEKGKISANIKPSQYMEMYSYGIYLVRALQDIKRDCEDLKTASALLKKLLDDIHNPNIDSTNNDSFVEDFPSTSDTLNTATSPRKTISISKSIEDTNVEFTSKSSNIYETSCEGQSITKTTTEVFSSSSAGQTKNQNQKDNENSIAVENTTYKSKSDNNNITTVHNKDVIVKATDTTDKNKDETDNSLTVREPKIIRVFTKCPEFENRPELDYDLDEDADIFDEQYGDYQDEILKLCEVSESLDDRGVPDEIKVKQFFSILSKEIKETFLEVMALCETSYKDLLDVNVSDQIKCMIGVKAEQARSHMGNLCKSLDSILLRDGSDTDENINCWLKKAGIGMISDKNLEDYKKLIKNCKDQAETFISTVDIIVKAAKL